MKRVFYSIFFASSLLMMSCGGEHTETQENEVKEPVKATFTVNAQESSIDWKGSKVGEDDFHTGKLGVAGGTIETTDEVITSGVFNIDMNTLEVTDPNLDSTFAGKLLGHLKSVDFFAVDSISNVKFEMTSFEDGVMKGDLTILDKSNPVELKPEVMITDAEIHITGTVTVDMKPYGVPYLQGPAEGEEVYINPVVELTLDVKATK